MVQNLRLTRWCHETLLRILDSNLLPIYLDILQVLKAKCPVLVEHMIHSSMNMGGGEAFALLLKRPWNPAVGLYNTERQVSSHCFTVLCRMIDFVCRVGVD